jgi:ectoine hydroxylase-related dioxygenase (phytanoyl-CoA dioxygenase family)
MQLIALVRASPRPGRRADRGNLEKTLQSCYMIEGEERLDGAERGRRAPGPREPLPGLFRLSRETAMPFLLSDAQRDQFARDGFVIVERLFDSIEIGLLGQIARADRVLAGQADQRRDGAGGVIRVSVRNELRDDIYSAFVRCRRIVEAMEKLLDGEVYHYHHKMIFKEPQIGGAWEWHQDYGYWYDIGCLFPDLASCLIAVDPATRANGCLQVLKGSHRMGRLNHGPIGDQTGADLERVRVAVARLERVYCELEPGDAIFFHCNLLHRSDRNDSDQPRWAFICCYNAARNDPYMESRHPRYSYLEKWPDSRIKEIGAAEWERLRPMVEGATALAGTGASSPA